MDIVMGLNTKYKSSKKSVREKSDYLLSSCMTLKKTKKALASAGHDWPEDEQS